MSRFVATLVADGTLDEEETFDAYDEAVLFLEQAIVDCQAPADGYIMECFCEEDSDEPCECSQWATDHHPVVTNRPQE